MPHVTHHVAPHHRLELGHPPLHCPCQGHLLLPKLLLLLLPEGSCRGPGALEHAWRHLHSQGIPGNAIPGGGIAPGWAQALEGPRGGDGVGTREDTR